MTSAEVPRRWSDLPEDTAHLAERTVQSHRIWRGVFLDVRQDAVALPDGARATREYIVHPGAVMVVPLLDDGSIVCERQWRYPMGRAMLEFPAGKLESGEPAVDCAVRELEEETGYRAAEWARAGATHNAIAYADEVIEIWFARGLSRGARKLDHGEFLDVCTATPDELDAAAAAGRITDAKTLVGLLWLARWRSGAWPLEWRAAADSRQLGRPPKIIERE